MLKINANIGDLIVVTLVKSPRGLEAEQRINTRRAFAVEEEDFQVRPGAVCLVELTDENDEKTEYVLKVIEVRRNGIGGFSLLQIMRDATDVVRDTRAALEIARSFHQHDAEGLLASLVDLVESYEITPSPRPILDFDLVYIRATLARRQLRDDSPAVQAYLRYFANRS